MDGRTARRLSDQRSQPQTTGEVTLGRLVSGAAQAEGVPCRVGVDPERAARPVDLIRGSDRRRARRKHRSFRSTEVRDVDVEVELLRDAAVGPGRRHVVQHALERQTRALRATDLGTTGRRVGIRQGQPSSAE